MVVEVCKKERKKWIRNEDAHISSWLDYFIVVWLAGQQLTTTWFVRVCVCGGGLCENVNVNGHGTLQSNTNNGCFNLNFQQKNIYIYLRKKNEDTIVTTPLTLYKCYFKTASHLKFDS